jgi:hypothetical protein
VRTPDLDADGTLSSAHSSSENQKLTPRLAAMSALFTMLHQDNMAAQNYNLTPDDFALACELSNLVRFSFGKR